MRALRCAALVALWGQCALAFFPGFYSPGSVREASQNYYEVMTNCEREGGECVDVNFGDTTDPPSIPETDAPPSTTTPRPRRTTTRAPPPPPTPAPAPPALPTLQDFFYWFPFLIPTTVRPALPPVPATQAPVPRYPVPVFPRLSATLAPPAAAPVRTPAPTPGPALAPIRIVTRAPLPPSTAAPKPTTKAPRKGRPGRRRNRGGEERETRRRRQALNPDPWDYLYNECTGGWEFDLGCSARGANVCCYSSNSNSPYKK